MWKFLHNINELIVTGPFPAYDVSSVLTLDNFTAEVSRNLMKATVPALTHGTVILVTHKIVSIGYFCKRPRLMFVGCVVGRWCKCDKRRINREESKRETGRAEPHSK